jgi:hypothetical protein
MTVFRRRTILVLLLVAAAIATEGSFAAESEQQRLEGLLRNKLALVFLFERDADLRAVAEKGQGLPQLENEIRGAMKDASDVAGFSDLLQDLLLQWARLEMERGNEDRGVELFEQVLLAGEGSRGYSEAALTLARLFVSRAKAFARAEDDEAALQHYARAEVLARRGGDAALAAEIARESATLKAKAGLQAYRAKDYDLAWDALSDLAAGGLPGFKGSEGDEALQWMNQNTGVLTVRTIPVTVPGRSVGGLDIRLDRVRNGENVTRRFAERFRWQVGEYRLILLGPDRKEVLSVPVSLAVTGGSAEIPSKLPDGMAYIPPGGRISRGFFIDRTEVTVGAFNRVFPSQRFRYGQQDFPAHGVTFRQAEAFAQKVGKRLPTFEQWQRAAFGDRKKRYPWGDTDPGSINRHCNVGTGRPRAVGSFPSGRNDFRLEDMAGNVWEWLRDGYAIGGGFLRGRLASTRTPEGWDHPVDYLRDKKPDDSVYAGFTDPAQRAKYDRYRIKAEIDKLEEVGFRCVLEF